MKSSIASYLLKRLKDHGVKHIFCVPGDYILKFHKMIEEDPDLKYINATKEDCAGFMADAYARMKGLGVVSVTYGVSLSIANSIAQAYVENSPLVLISGAASENLFKKNRNLHHLINQTVSSQSDLTQLEIYKHMTVDQAVLNNPKTAAQEIDRCLANCLLHQKPIYFEIPVNSIDLELNGSTPKEFKQTEINDGKLKSFQEHLQECLKDSFKPIIWIGHQVQRFKMAPVVQTFAEKYQIPIVSNFLGKSGISEYHSLYLGTYRGAMSRDEVRQYVEDADCLIALGIKFSEMDLGIFTAKLDHKNKIFMNAEKAEINGKNHAISFIQSLEQLESIKLDNPFSVAMPVTQQSTFNPKKSTKTTVSRFFECLQSHLQTDSLVVTDIGDCLFGSIDLKLHQNAYLSCAEWAGMGFAVPGAVGAQLAVPNKRVIAIVGDGGFQMTGLELSTALKYHLDPIVFVLNNFGYGTERIIIEGAYNDIQNWNYAEIPRVLGGGVGIKATTEEELEEAMQKAFEKRGDFYLIEIILDKEDFSIPRERFRKFKKANPSKL